MDHKHSLNSIHRCTWRMTFCPVASPGYDLLGTKKQLRQLDETLHKPGNEGTFWPMRRIDSIFHHWLQSFRPAWLHRGRSRWQMSWLRAVRLTEPKIFASFILRLFPIITVSCLSCSLYGAFLSSINPFRAQNVFCKHDCSTKCKCKVQYRGVADWPYFVVASHPLHASHLN